MSSLYLYLGIYIAALFLISFLVSRKQTEEDFLISGRNRAGWQIFASKFAAAIGAGYFIAYTGFAYEYGLGVFAMLLGIICGYLAFAYWAAPKIASGSKEKKFYTIGHFVYDKTKSKWAMYLADIFSSGILFAWLATGIIGGAKIIEDFGFLSYNNAVVLTSVVVLIYLLMAGHKAVILTDIVQSFVIVFLLIIVTYGIVSNNVSEIFSFTNFNLNLGVTAGFFFFGLLSVFSSSDRYQLAYAAKNERGLKHGLGLAIIPVIFVACLLLLIGIFMAEKIPGLDSGLIFTESLKNFLSPKLLPLAIVLFFAGVMSSVDTDVYAIASHYCLSRGKRSIHAVRNSIIVLMVIISLVAIIFPDVVKVSIIAGAISLTLSFSMVYILFGGKNPSRFAGSALTSLVALIIGIFIWGLEPVLAVFVLLAGAFGLLWNIKRPSFKLK